MTVSLLQSGPPAPKVGEIVYWTASSDSQSSGRIWYRYVVSGAEGEIYALRDFAPETNTFEWAASEHEGTYTVEVTAFDDSTNESSSTTNSFRVEPRVSGATAAVSETAHPLVLLYSAPPCPAGSRIRVDFFSPDNFAQSTNYKDCSAGQTMNFYLGGLRANSVYRARHVITDGVRELPAPMLSFQTGTPAAAVEFAPYQLVRPPADRNAKGILLQTPIAQAALATDLLGNLVWYYPRSITYLTRPVAGGTFLVLDTPTPGTPEQQIVREIDLPGNTIRETNAAQVNRQLRLYGRRPITAFHHEALPRPDGGIIVLASTEQMLVGVQGDGPVDVLGDMIIALDRNLQVVWTWDAFDFMDPSREAIRAEICSPAGGGCPSFDLAPVANDWLHGNAIQLTKDGSILYSSRHQDWLLKIDYRDGQGTGEIVWRLGKDGDFGITSLNSYPWFSHQHDARLLDDGTTLVVFDNGNTRWDTDPTAHSRGQVYRLDEENLTAELLLDADIGDFSQALGSTQRLPNGNYHFLAGWMSDLSSLSLEVDPAGNIVYALSAGVRQYRSFRMQDLYTP